MKPNEIWLAKQTMDKARRDYRKLIMEDYDSKVFYPMWKDLIAECETNGHGWQFSSFNLGGHAIYRCAYCQASKLVKEDEDPTP